MGFSPIPGYPFVPIWALLMQDVCITAGALGLFTVLLGSVTGTVTVLFKLLLASKDSQIAEWKRLAERATETSGKAVEFAAERETRS